ncbi:hypothetical protein LTR17_027171, partial [Elasticomyces elasticus]
MAGPVAGLAARSPPLGQGLSRAFLDIYALQALTVFAPKPDYSYDHQSAYANDRWFTLHEISKAGKNHKCVIIKSEPGSIVFT